MKKGNYVAFTVVVILVACLIANCSEEPADISASDRFIEQFHKADTLVWHTYYGSTQPPIDKEKILELVKLFEQTACYDIISDVKAGKPIKWATYICPVKEEDMHLLNDALMKPCEAETIITEPL